MQNHQAHQGKLKVEFLKITKIIQEIPGRRYGDNELWLNVSRSTVQLDHNRGEWIVWELQTEEEHLLDRFTDGLYNQRNGDSESEEKMMTILKLKMEG